MTKVNCSLDSPTFSISAVIPLNKTTILSVNETGKVILAVPAISIPVNSYLVIVSCSSGSLINTTYFNFSRTNENEFPPQLAHNFTTFYHIPESLGHHSVVADINATDKDYGIYGDLVYEIVDGNTNNAFSIESSTGVISVSKTLNYASQNIYNLQLQISNYVDPQASIPQFTDANVTIYIFAVPHFNATLYTASVPETGQSTTGVSYPRPQMGFITVLCTDLDTPANEVSYNLSLVNDIFIIDSTTGQLQVVSDLDYDTESGQFYEFHVICTDGFSSDSALVQINVEPVNEHIPEVVLEPKLFFLRGNESDFRAGRIIISNIKRDDSSGIITATDQDLGPDGQITFVLESINFNSFGQPLLGINSSTGEVQIINDFDADDGGIGTSVLSLFRVGVYDQSAAYGSTDQCFLIIFKEADELPTFSKDVYDFTTSESTAANTELLLNITCTDHDSLKGVFSHFGFLNGTKASFSLNNKTGQVYLKNMLDYESSQIITFWIACYDDVGKFDTAKIIINVTPYNDEIPYFSTSNYTFYVSRTTPANLYYIGYVLAYDDDLDYGSNLTYSLLNPYFYITPTTGQIYLLKSVLDVQESILEYNVTVTDDDESHTASAHVTFNITQGNYLAPEFITQYPLITISELLPINSEVLTVFCNDTESGNNGLVSYEILTGNVASAFSINATSGVIFVTNSLILPQNVTSASYILEVRCFDHGVPSLSDITIVRIQVTISYTMNPDISNDTIVSFVNEDAALNSLVVTITAIYYGNSGLEYYLYNESVKMAFDIHSTENKGNVLVNTQLDRELTGTYFMVVVVQAPDNTSDSADLFIHVRDVNDNPPECAATVATLQIHETTKAGDKIFNLNCTDSDAAQNANLTYLLQNDYGIVDIDSTGSVYIMNHLNMTNSSTLYLLITVSDQGFVPQTIMVTLIVNILSINKFAPEFTNLPVVLNISEATSVFLFPLFTVEAIDSDRGEFGTVRFTLTNESSLPFILVPNTGELYLEEKLDFHTQQYYSLQVIATDSTYSVHSTITVNVIDANEYPPTCTSTFFSRVFIEDIPPSALETISLGCFDSDQGPFGTLRYNITSGNINNDFSVSSNGYIQANNKLDYERTQTYNLIVLVSDMGEPPKSELIDIHIAVSPVNEHTPQIHNGPYSVSIYEDADIGQTILHVNASDEDSGNDGTLKYRLIPDQTSFGITNNGYLLVIGSLDRELTSNYSFTVIVNDIGTITKSTSSPVVITILDIDDSAPTFTKSLYISTVSDGMSQIGYTVVVTKCIDPDEGDNAAIDYFILPSESASFFSISSLGVITINSTLPLSSIYSFTVKCSGVLNANLTDTAFVSITIQINSNITFGNLTYTHTLLESIYPVFTFLTINATTVTETTLMYSLVESPSIFQIQSFSGQLSLVGYLDFESNQSYVLIVEAVDGAMPPNSAQVAVNIYVQNVNDGFPTFTDMTTNIILIEEQQYSLPIGTYVCTDSDLGVFGDITYHIFSGNVNSTFAIDEISGQLQLKGTVDYESIKSINLLIHCADGGTPSFNDSALVTITIQPVNEYPPQFNALVITFAVDELVSVPNVISLNNELQATDMDDFPHNQIWYSITSGNDDQVFTISPTTGILSLIKNLDYEMVSDYHLVVQADDGGGLSSPSYAVLNSTTQVNILVSDANDHSPVFTRNIYVGSIRESALPGDYVNSLTLNCTDEDSGSNGQTALTIESGNTGNAFAVLSNGKIRVNNTLDFEVTSSFYLTVRCSDQGTTPRIDEVIVIINIIDESEFGPEFQAHSYEFSVNETAFPGTILGRVIAIDQDTGSAGDVMYTISNNTDVPFGIDPSTGDIILITPLDYETGPATYNLFVFAYDFVNRTDLTVVAITVINNDDNVPHFTASNYYGLIRETSPPGTSVNFANTISCTDLDDSADGLSTVFTLLSSAGDTLDESFPLSIHQTTGVITALVSLDLETTDRYSFTVMCSDSAGNTESAGVTVDLTPYNDFAPKFNGTPYVVTIQEGVNENSIIFSVVATDEDLSDYNTITYSIVSGNDVGIFSIDPISGVIRNIQDIDFEQASHYLLNVSAENVIPVGDASGSPSLASFTDLTINVTDINDNSPVISPPSATAVIRAEDEPGTFVLTVTCEDEDSGLFGETELSLSGPVAHKFSLLDNGTIITLENITNDLLLIINCSDLGSPPRSTTAEITIFTSSSNDFAPVFPQGIKYFYVLENFTVGESIGCYPAADADGPHTADGILTYILTHIIGPNHFYVVESTGCIVLAVGLDYDDATMYTYNLRAQDGGIPQRFADAIIVITILNVDIDPPQFTESAYSREISEGFSPGAIVTESILCTDRDDDDVITYSIVGGNDDGIFMINESTGVIRLASSLDYESAVLHSLKIRCNDSTDLFDEVNMTVTVLPVNEHTPIIIPKEVHPNEQSSIGTPITIIEYTDLDAGIDGEVVFDIPDPYMSNLFVIAGHTLIFNQILDREAEGGGRYDIEVRVTDLATISRSSKGFINISLTDINDNAPVPSKPLYTSMYINETVSVGTNVVTVTCTDLDLGINSQVQYTIEDNSLFAINNNNGVVSVFSDLRYRHNDVIALEVYCTDMGTPTLTSSTIVQIPVISINYYPPVFLNTPFTITLLENFTTLVPFANVSAMDNDTGLNGVVTYRLLDNYENQFYINHISGEISLLLPLDYESTSSYILTVIAVDGSNDSLHMNRKMDMLNITIEVQGVNEYSPMCTKPIYVGYINETDQGFVLQLNCSDDDLGVDGYLSYSISSSLYSSFFTIDSNGKLSIISPIAANNSIVTYELTAIISDMGTPSKQINVQINLIYSFQNMYSPMFNQSSYHIFLSELTLVGEVVYTFYATDRDPGIQGEVLYSVQNTDYFRINTKTGELYLSMPLDWETVSAFDFQVVAFDSDPYNHSSSIAIVNVTLFDENDNFPVCAQSFYTVIIHSDLNVTDTVFNVGSFCNDSDGPLHSLLSYDIYPSTTFTINDNGIVLVNGSLNASNTYILTVTVNDNGSPPLSTKLTLTVQVQFINKVAPVFLSAKYNFIIPENTSILTNIGEVQAVDGDSHDTDLIFSIVTPANNAILYIGPMSGEILLLAPVDYEDNTMHTFTVMVEDGGSYDGSNVLFSIVEVTITVSNVNDNNPILNNGGLYGAVVNKTTTVGTVVINVHCRDDDLAPYGNPLLMQSYDSSIPFNLTSFSSNSSLQVSDDLTTLNGSHSFLINFTCVDQGGKKTIGLAHVFVPDNKGPVFTSSSYEWIIPEDSETGTTFANVQAISQDGSVITYSIEEGNTQSTFYIHPSTGVISLAQTLDYETKTLYGLIITAQDTNNKISKVFLLVKVADVDDVIPLLSPTAFMTVENYRDPGYPIGFVNCTSQDSNTSLLVFQFNSSTTTFRIDSNGIVYVNQTLDTTPVYVIPIICYLETQPDMYSTGVLTIEVIFVNQHVPEFQYNLYQVSVPEDIAIFSVVTTVHAVDEDIGSFGYLSYSIISGNSEVFYINSLTGTIHLLTSLDREENDVFTLTIQAVDGGTTQLNTSVRNSATTTVIINVLDINDNTPVFDKPSYVQFIFTNHSVLSPILQVQCSDSDLAENGTIIYSIQPSQDNFIIDNNGTLLLGSDLSAQAVYSFNISCYDMSSVPSYSSAIVTIVIQKVDYNSPVFEQEQYLVTIPEDQMLLTTFMTVFANTSNDDTTVTYSIVAGNEDNHISINSQTGELFLIHNIDYIMKNFYTLTVRASTNSFIQYSSYATVNISIVDVNDNNPFFLPIPFYVAVVSENANIPTPVVQVNCSDLDPTNSLKYLITNSVPSDGFNLFNITSEGLVIVQQMLDYETTTSFTLTVECSDGGMAPAEAIVQVNIGPVNEYKPVFLKSKYSFATFENEMLGVVIGNVTAVDFDDGSDGEISYLLQDPGYISPVFVHPSSGEILISNIIDYETVTFYNLSVIARDFAGSETYVPVEITVINLHDVPPVLTPAVSVHINRVLTTSPLGLFIQSYVCVDADGGFTNLSIIDGNSLGLFSLNELNQIVWNSLSVNFTSDVVISLTIQCVDISNATDTASLAVVVGHPNAIPPLFNASTYVGSVMENATIGTIVLTVSALGKPNNTIEYSLFNLPINFPFIINHTSGEIIVNETLDYETIQSYTFPVQAKDTNLSSIGLTTVKLSITDVNDNSPTILPSLLSLYLMENSVTGIAYAKFTCTDHDSNNNGATHYSVEPSNPVFIDPLSGFVVLQTSLDYESDKIHNITVWCTDGGSPPLYDSATLLIEVLGINEYSPQFSMKTYNYTVSEKAALSTIIGSVDAIDNDHGSNGDFYFMDYGGSGSFYFSVNSTSGDIFLKNFLNASVADQLTLVIAAIDYGPITSLISTTKVDITLIDVNEKPYFDVSSYIVSTNVSSIDPGDILTTVNCYDYDIGHNSKVTLLLYAAASNVSLMANTSGNGFISSPLILTNLLMPGSYEVIIECIDYGYPQLSNNISVVLIIKPANTPPKFGKQVYGLSVNEDTQTGSILLVINATDVETGVTYGTVGGTGIGTFGVGIYNGELTLLGNLDYEVVQTYLLTVSAVDNDFLNPLTATAQISIVVVNVNDHPPVIMPTTFSTTRPEGNYANESIQQYICSDADGGTTSLSVSPSPPFTFNENGQVLLNGTIDYESSTLLTAIIVCTDSSVAGADGIQSATATLSISVSPVNFDAPVVVSPSIFNVSEGSEVSHVIANISAYDPDTRGIVTYNTDSHNDVFILNASNGQLVLVKTLDRESVDVYHLNIVVSDNDNAQGISPKVTTQLVTIYITDINDHSPSCDVTLQTITILAGTYNDTVSLFNASCHDQDIGQNSILVYMLNEQTLPNEAYFSLNYTSGELHFNGTITKASSSSIIVITVADMGTNPVSTPANIQLILIVLTGDEPRFEPNYFNITISENHPPISHPVYNGSVLTNALLNADGAEIQFSFITNTTEFVIDAGTGNIYLLSSAVLDYDEGQQKFSLGIQAIINTQEAEAILDIYLSDYNDNSPVFSNHLYTGMVMENLAPGQSVLTVSAMDIDSGNNAVVRYSIPIADANFHIDSISGLITTLKQFDRELISSYTLTVQATDMGDPVLSSSVAVDIQIGDENDNAPYFVNALYNFIINDLSMAGQVIHTFTAVDLDITGSIRYALITSDTFIKDLLSLNSFTGVLSLKTSVPPDHEVIYSFKVSANDEIHTTETDVVIQIATLSHTEISMKENVANQTYNVYNFLQLSSNLTSNAVYMIIKGDAYEQFDIIDNGILINVAPLDRENISFYSLEISAFDNTSNEHSILRLDIDIADENDNAPVFNSSVYTFNISEGHFSVQTLIGVVYATDADKENTENSRITYSLIEKPSANIFDVTLNTITGELTVSGILDREASDVYFLRVVAEDHGEPLAMYGFSEVYVYLYDINDNAPRFSTPGATSFIVYYVANVPLGSPPHSIIVLSPFSSSTKTDGFYFSDPDSSDFAFISLSGSTNISLASNSSPAYMISTGDITFALNNTEFEVILSDGDKDHTVKKSVHLVIIEVQSFTLTSITPTFTTTALETSPSVTVSPTEDIRFIETALGIGILVVGFVMFFALVLFIFCLMCFCYQYYRKKKDTAQRSVKHSNYYLYVVRRPTSVFKRVESEHKNHKNLSSANVYRNPSYQEFDPLDQSYYTPRMTEIYHN